MMTDGAVDVHRDTEQYGSDWQVGEQTAIDQQLTLTKKRSPGVAAGIRQPMSGPPSRRHSAT